MTVLPIYGFSPAQFLHDIKITADAIGAAYSESMTRTVLDVHRQLSRWCRSLADHRQIRRSAQLPVLRTAAHGLGRHAIRAGLLDPSNPLTALVSSWSSLYDGTATELCDFDADHGITKTWIYLGGMRPLEQVLGAPGVPRTICGHERRFPGAGLDPVRHVAVDYRANTVNLYFRTSHKITRGDSEQFVAVANGTPPGPSLFSDMEKLTPPDGYTFSVTMAVDSGDIQRVGYYALKLPAGQFPVIAQGNDYIKAERSYSGRLVALMKTWNSPMADTS